MKSIVKYRNHGISVADSIIGEPAGFGNNKGKS